MSADQLRETIIEKQRPQCKSEPDAHAVANYLGAFIWDIFTEEIGRHEERRSQVLRNLGYDSIEFLRNDARELITQLDKELGPQKDYFPGFRDQNS